MSFTYATLEQKQCFTVLSAVFTVHFFLYICLIKITCRVKAEACILVIFTNQKFDKSRTLLKYESRVWIKEKGQFYHVVDDLEFAIVIKWDNNPANVNLKT